ncbi:MAG: PEP/pyruvate-binding domain-containing protein [Actinomycetota bacterium]
MNELKQQTATIVSFEEESCRDVRVAGGKGASLAKMVAEGLPVPPGFVISSHVLERSVDAERLRALALARDHEGARALVRRAEPPRAEISAAYGRLGGGKVAVRSSACAEDSEAASYAGQQETFLDVQGAEAVCGRVVDCWSSFFSERALFYRAQKGSLEDLRMAVVVQKMVAPEKSGVLFTADPVRRRRDRMVIESAFGLGEQVVSGEVTPDHYVVDRSGRLKRERVVGERVLDEEELRRLAGLGRMLEERHGSPQDIEWAMAGGEIYLLQSRPITTL